MKPISTNKRPIVCGTDFSAMAMEAADVAVAMARKVGTKLLLIHVDDFWPRDALETLYGAAISHTQKTLEREAKRLRKTGVTVAKRLLVGSAFDELVNAAIKSRAWLLVFGAVSHSLRRRLLVGSVAERTAEASPLPTLVVRPGGGLSACIRGKRALKILVGYDFSAAGEAALKWASQMQQLWRCEITVLYVSWPPDEARRLGYEGPLLFAADPKMIRESLERELAKRVARFLPGKNVKTFVEAGWGRPDGFLLDAASRYRVDLIVVGTHQRAALGRALLGSVSRAILRNGKCGVVVVPPAADGAALRPAHEIERVLAATDFSALGNEAVAYGCAALPRGGTLKLIHVSKPTRRRRPGKKSRFRKTQDQLRALVPTTGRQPAIETEVVEKDNPAEAIIQAAERFGADLICLGSHARTGLAKVFLGSVAQSVMKKSKRPVLVVRQETK